MPRQTPQKTSTLHLAKKFSQTARSETRGTPPVFNSGQTSTPITSRLQALAVRAQCQPFLLSLVPKAIRAYAELLDSDNPRLKLVAATKVLEASQMLSSRGGDPVLDTAEAADQRREEQRFIVGGMMTEMMLKKSAIHGWDLPEGLRWLKPQLEMIEKQIAERKEALSEPDGLGFKDLT
jgi:hypothetical protein